MLSQNYVITEKDVLERIGSGCRELVLQPGTLITPAAQDVIRSENVNVRWGGAVSGQQQAVSAGVLSKRDPCQSGSTYCLRCGACVEPANVRGVVSDTESLLSELNTFTRDIWINEPSDIRELRQFALPLMGTLPCVFYANFDLFWAGEMIQVCRLQALEKAMPLKELNRMIGALLERSAARVSKWKMKDTVRLIRGVSDFFKDSKPQSYDQVVRILETTLVALDRMQSWIDAILPWSELDQKLELRNPLPEVQKIAPRGSGNNCSKNSGTGVGELGDLNQMVKRIVAEVMKGIQ